MAGPPPERTLSTSCPPWTACQGWILASTPSSPSPTVSAGLRAGLEFTQPFPPLHPEGKTNKAWLWAQQEVLLNIFSHLESSLSAQQGTHINEDRNFWLYCKSKHEQFYTTQTNEAVGLAEAHRIDYLRLQCKAHSLVPDSAYQDVWFAPRGRAKLFRQFSVLFLPLTINKMCNRQTSKWQEISFIF